MKTKDLRRKSDRLLDHEHVALPQGAEAAVESGAVVALQVQRLSTIRL